MFAECMETLQNVGINASVKPESFPDWCDPAVIFPMLRLGIYRFTFELLDGHPSASFSGSAWRGALGWSLQKLFCRQGDGICPGCACQSGCPYNELYEQHSRESGFADPPRPYVLFPLPSATNGLLQVEITLIGPGCFFLPYIAAALEMAGNNGLGKGRDRRRLSFVSIEQRQPDGAWLNGYLLGKRTVLKRDSFPLADYLAFVPSPPAAPWRVEVVTSLRLRKESVNLGSLDLAFAFTTLGIRLDLLHILCGGNRMTQGEWQHLKSFLQEPGECRSTTHWHDWHRKSSTQKKLVPMGGVVGTILVTPSARKEQVWWRWWKTAELFHLGKGTTMGNGKIIMEGANDGLSTKD